MAKKPKISVVMAVYKNDKAAWLEEAIESILNQTLKADEFIVVVDGPVPSEINSVLKSYAKHLRVIRIRENKGLWNALNVGIDTARNELIARMDSDDISLPERLAVQAREFGSRPELAIVGGQVLEFEGNDATAVTGKRSVPLADKDIRVFARRRSPFNHPSVMYRRSVIIGLGGYSKLLRSEDYDLWMRVLESPSTVCNVADPVLLFRVDGDGIKRRKRLSTVIEQISLRRSFLRRGYIGRIDFLVVASAMVTVAILPVGMVTIFYRKLLRTGATE